MVDFEIKRDTESLAERRAAQKQHLFVKKIILATTVAIVIVGGGIIISQLNRATVHDPPIASSEPSPELSRHEPEASPTSPVPNEQSKDTEVGTATLALVDDDGQTMWVSPTHGSPLELVHLPAESQFILILRPGDLHASGELDRIAAAMGPYGEAGIAWLERAAGRRWESIDQVVIAMHLKPDYTPDVVMVVYPTGSWGDATSLPGLEIWKPEGANHYVVATPVVLGTLKELPRRAALRRDFEALLARSDNERQVTLLMANSLVGSPTGPLWHGPWARLRSAVFAWLPDESQAFALSLHWGETFFAEMRLVATLDQRPEKFAERLHQKTTEGPAQA